MSKIYISNNLPKLKITTNIEYFDYATQSNAIPSGVASDSVGNGTVYGNYANYNYSADWGGQDGNVTTVGTNGLSSFYGTYDQSGQVWELHDTLVGISKGVRGGSWLNTYDYIGATYSGFIGSGPSFGNANVGFRIAGSATATETYTSPIEMITVGNANNSPDNTGYGSVSYNYRIGKYPITNSQFCNFLNLKAVSDPYSLYNTNMGSNARGGISRSGSSGSYSYTVKTNMENKPVVYVSWYDAARYVNWLHNGMGSGSTETGAYTLSGAMAGIFTKNITAKFWIPSEDEWYKAAFYQHQTLYKVL